MNKIKLILCVFFMQNYVFGQVNSLSFEKLLTVENFNGINLSLTNQNQVVFYYFDDSTSSLSIGMINNQGDLITIYKSEEGVFNKLETVLVERQGFAFYYEDNYLTPMLFIIDTLKLGRNKPPRTVEISDSLFSIHNDFLLSHETLYIISNKFTDSLVVMEMGLNKKHYVFKKVEGKSTIEDLKFINKNKYCYVYRTDSGVVLKSHNYKNEESSEILYIPYNEVSLLINEDPYINVLNDSLIVVWWHNQREGKSFYNIVNSKTKEVIFQSNALGLLCSMVLTDELILYYSVMVQGGEKKSIQFDLFSIPTTIEHNYSSIVYKANFGSAISGKGHPPTGAQDVE